MHSNDNDKQVTAIEPVLVYVFTIESVHRLASFVTIVVLINIFLEIFCKMEWCDIESGKYKIVSLSAATFPGALEIIRDAFCQDEAVSIGTEVNKNPLAAEELLELCADAALDGVSLVVVESSSGEVVSVAFNKLQIPATDSLQKPFFEIFAEERCTQDSSRSLVKFMADVDGRVNLFEKYGVDCSLEIMFLATHSEHRNRRLGYFLCNTSIDVAKKLKDGHVTPMTIEDLGPKYADIPPRPSITKLPKICQAIWTGKYSQKIGKSLGFKVHLKVPMSEFVHNGKTYAERLGDKSAFIEVAALALN